MKRDELIDLSTLQAELLQDFERQLQPEAGLAPASAKPAGGWTDSFRASGAKHM
jgi:hypothetical protein